MFRRAVVFALLAAAGVLAGCSSASDDEPAGRSTGTGSSASDPSAPTGEPTGEGEPTDTETPPEPSPTFTQPYLPEGEQSVIDLPAELPIEPPDGATEAEREVVAALGRFMASWNAVLFGAGVEQSGIEETSSGDQRARLRDFVAEAEDREWVFVGQPMVVDAISVTVDGNGATSDVCIALPLWYEYIGGRRETLPEPSPERYIVTLRRSGGTWTVSDTSQQDAAACPGQAA